MKVKIRNKIENIKIKDLQKYANNNKKHSDKQIKLLKENIERFGFTTPLLVDKKSGEIIAGHGRALAAEELGMEEVPFLDVSDLSAIKKKELRIADNKVTEMSEWDFEALRIELGEINRDGLIDITGFDLSDLNVFGDKKNYSDVNKEIDLDSLDEEMDHECPKCGFKFKDDK